MNGKRVPKTRKQFYDLVEKYNCTVDVCMFGNGEYDIVVDSHEDFGFDNGTLPAKAINNSFSDEIRTAKQFWTFAYYDILGEFDFYEPMSEEYKRLYE